MIHTPFGVIEVLIDGKPIEYRSVRLPLDNHTYFRSLSKRYAIPVSIDLDGLEHTIDCVVMNMREGIVVTEESGQDLESVLFEKDNRHFNMNIACFGEPWDPGCTVESLESGFDYDTWTLDNGMRYIVMPTTQTKDYIFGISWKDDGWEIKDQDTLYGADPSFYDEKDRWEIERPRIDLHEMVKIVVEKFPEQKEHIEYCVVDGKVLGHVFGVLAIAEPMIQSFNKDEESFNRWCEVVEKIYQDADDKVEDVVYGTIIERLEEDRAIFEAFHNRISERFRRD